MKCEVDRIENYSNVLFKAYTAQRGVDLYFHTLVLWALDWGESVKHLIHVGLQRPKFLPPAQNFLLRVREEVSETAR